MKSVSSLWHRFFKASSTQTSPQTISKSAACRRVKRSNKKCQSNVQVCLKELAYFGKASATPARRTRIQTKLGVMAVIRSGLHSSFRVHKNGQAWLRSSPRLQCSLRNRHSRFCAARTRNNSRKILSTAPIVMRISSMCSTS